MLTCIECGCEIDSFDEFYSYMMGGPLHKKKGAF